MELLPATLIALLAGLTGIAVHYSMILRKSLDRARTDIDALRKLASDNLAGINASEEPYIRMVVEIKDPIALAHRESRLAKLASGTAPNLVIKKVYEQVVAETREQMKGKKVDANISIVVI